ncbi:enterobactin synthetase component F [Salmonella enterica subsp. enterica]|uniref:Enterobactin synthetase component F n=1 Tax=Salmonella enterica I TaxID=59201 RepID=A0A447U7U6_SALET|nr:enterobactin synthetase component F [Salmonella enterica subsp. enterica]
MTQRLPLVAAQPGIWMAEKLSDLPSAWSVAHYVELNGELDAALLAKAVAVGMQTGGYATDAFYRRERRGLAMDRS